MKIRLALLDNDSRYLERIVSVFGVKYPDNMEIYSFTDPKIALNTLSTARIDVFLASTNFEIDTGAIPKHCCFAYFVDSNDIETFRDQKTVRKFQKVDLIYREILSLYSEQISNITELRIDSGECRIVTFFSPSGGSGSSTVAAAYALRLCSQGKRVLYLNLEKFGSADVFFNAEGQFNMSDVIFALKSKKTNMALKLQGCLKQEKHGVFFYSQSTLALDMLELKRDDISQLVSQCTISGLYDVMIIDIDFSLSDSSLDILKKSSSIVITGDGSAVSNVKVNRALSAISVLEQTKDISLMNRMVFLYNKFSSKSSKEIENLEIKNIGGFPRFEQAGMEQLLTQLSSMNALDHILF